MLQKFCRKIVLGASIITLCLSSSVQANPMTMEVDHPVYISQAQGNPSVVIGMDAKASKLDNKAYEYVNVEVTQGDDIESLFTSLLAGNIKGIQFDILVDDEIDEAYWYELGELSLGLDKIIWFNFIPIQEGLGAQITQLTQVLEEATSEAHFNAVRFVYTPTTIEQVGKLVGKGERLIHITVESQEDLELLEEIYKTYRNEVDVFVTDAIIQNAALTTVEQVKLINKFYYELPLEYPNIEAIYQADTVYNYPDAIKNTYRRVLSQSWLSLEDYMEQGQMYTPVEYVTEISNQPMQLVVMIEDETIEYVEYKLNGKFLGRTTTYPYAWQINSDDIYQGNNELRTVIKYKDSDVLEVECNYISSEYTAQVQERYARTTPTYPVGQDMSYETGYIPVLMYHMFKDVVEDTEQDQSVSVSTQLFEQHIQRLNKEGYTPITFLDYENYLNGIGGLPAKPYIITADDGYLDNYTHAFPILEKYNVPATFFITTQYVGIPTNFDHFTWDQAREMEASGLVDIQSHTNAHTLLNTVDKAAVNYEINRSFGEIEQQLGKRDVKVLAYPQFQHSEDTQQWVSEFGVALQMTNLIREGVASTPIDVKRIHVHNQMSSDDLIKEIERLTH